VNECEGATKYPLLKPETKKDRRTNRMTAYQKSRRSNQRKNNVKPEPDRQRFRS